MEEKANITEYLRAIEQNSDPLAMIDALQEFFDRINEVKTFDAMKLVSLYSAVSILAVNGLNRESVQTIKAAIIAKMKSLHAQFPELVKAADIALSHLVERDEK